MGKHKIKRGLDVPIAGEPKQEISAGPEVGKAALLGSDYLGMKPTMAVAVGDTVQSGQLLFTDKKMPLVRFTSPGSGKVVAINRGAKRIFISIVIELEGHNEITFKTYPADKLASLTRKQVVELLLESGLWPSLRARPFSKTANPETTPHSIFITAMDTNPLAPSISKIMEGKETSLNNGLTVISRLTEGKLYFCKSPQENIPTPSLSSLSVEEFSGPHPAGLVGTHIHCLDPVGRHKTVWHIGIQDVIAIGKLFTTGKLDMERIISLAGPSVKEPQLIKTRVGASVDDITRGTLQDGENRVISGSVLSGHIARDDSAYLGKYHQQISVLGEGRDKEFLGWLNLGLNKYSLKNTVLSKFTPGKKFAFNTALNGGKRSIVPIGSYEKVMPLDILPTFLLRGLAVNDVEEVEKLGVLELDEEDIALCTFVCPSKIDYGPLLRENLTIIEKEG